MTYNYYHYQIMKQSTKTSRSTANRNEPDVTGLRGNKLDFFYLFIIIIVVVMSFHSYIIIFRRIQNAV